VGQVHERIDDDLREFIDKQHLYFVGTAPADTGGHVNLSPKGHRDTFAVLDDSTVAYVDLTGSGAESLAHIRENGRVVIMFCAFEGPPNIVRLHGQGRLVFSGDGEWDGLLAHFPSRPGIRAIVTVHITRVSSSCGFAVPFYDYVGQRDLLERWTERKSEADLDEYRAKKNATSIDGLPAVP
jgi:hypothetical protein